MIRFVELSDLLESDKSFSEIVSLIDGMLIQPPTIINVPNTPATKGTKKPLAKPIFPLGIEYELFSDFTDLNELLLFPIINFHPFLKLKK